MISSSSDFSSFDAGVSRKPVLEKGRRKELSFLLGSCSGVLEGSTVLHFPNHPWSVTGHHREANPSCPSEVRQKSGTRNGWLPSRLKPEKMHHRRDNRIPELDGTLEVFKKSHHHQPKQGTVVSFWTTGWPDVEQACFIYEPAYPYRRRVF